MNPIAYLIRRHRWNKACAAPMPTDLPPATTREVDMSMHPASMPAKPRPQIVAISTTQLLLTLHSEMARVVKSDQGPNGVHAANLSLACSNALKLLSPEILEGPIPIIPNNN